MSEPGVPAPEAKLPGLDGDEVQIGGGPALLVFFKRNCGACQIAVPKLTRVGEALAGLSVIAISQDAADETKRFVGKEAPGLRVAVDAPRYEASRAYDVETVPHFVLVDHSGTIVHTDFGWDRSAFNDLAARAGELVGAQVGEVVGPDDAPPFRPG